MEYIKKLIIRIIFLMIWLGIPIYFIITTKNAGFFCLAIFTWIPAALIASYLDSNETDYGC